MHFRTVKGKPTVILAKTFKGKGLPGVENLDGFHGKPLPREKGAAIQVKSTTRHNWTIPKPVYDAPEVNLNIGNIQLTPAPSYTKGEKVTSL